VAAIRRALDSGEQDRAGDLLHRLRGAGGALGAEELNAAAQQLELALAEKGPVDTGLLVRFFASAEAAVATLAALGTPDPDALSARIAEPGCEERLQRIQELAALLEAGNARALDHLPWLYRCLGAEATAQGKTLMRQIEDLDFPAALETLRELEEDLFASSR
jgi:HPt (histidine-containing phosphotransfer) domain-containing protein